jgi:hypothetical protein
VLWALGQPAAAGGLLLAFLLGLGLRVVAVRLTARSLRLVSRHTPVLPRPRVDVDPFGVVAALLGGTGWGRSVDLEELPPRAARGRRAAVYVAGPLATLVAGELALLGYRIGYPRDLVALLVNYPSDVLRGAVAPNAGAQFVLSLGVGLLCFALLAIVPLPPLDGFGLLWLTMSDATPAAQRARHWLADNNLGVAILLVALIFPFGGPFAYAYFNVLGTPLMRVWA